MSVAEKCVADLSCTHTQVNLSNRDWKQENKRRHRDQRTQYQEGTIGQGRTEKMRSYLRTLCVLALMLGVTKAFAATVDNLQMEVHVKITGTHDVIWAAGSGYLTPASLVPGAPATVAAGTSQTTGLLPNLDSVASGSNGTGASDLVKWEILTPLLGQVRATDAGADAAIYFRLDNVGNKKVDITAEIPNATAEDSVGAAIGDGHWEVGAAAGTSIFRLEIRATDSGVNTFDALLNPTGDPVSGIVAPAVLDNPGYTDLGPVGTGPIDLVHGWKRFQNHLEVDLRYSTPTDTTDDATEFDVFHVTTITIATTAQ